ncbi:MAG TPA: TraR/DksA family transcriptional regulator [Terriglobales bacterium]|nr:TraR/DksA family transcriptional regulator [Terriglobales bacterium]
MNREKLAKFRSMLQVRREELEHIVSVSQEHGRSVVEDYPQDTAERASIFASKEFFFANSTQGRRLLKMVSEALERMARGNYGQCVACEEEINFKRLEAVPWARYCLRCQERLEQYSAHERAA